MIREDVHSGTFYPAESAQLDELIALWKEMEYESSALSFEPRAALVPHAGYVFSGFTLYRTLKRIPFDRFRRVVLIGPSHRFFIDGVSVADHSEYAVPRGTHAMDREYSRKLAERFQLVSLEGAHREHSTETVMPLLDRFTDIPVVELIYGPHSHDDTQALVNYILDDPATVLIVSSDLSHFHAEQAAHTIDRHILHAVEQCDVKLLKQGEACGMLGLNALIQNAARRGWNSTLCDYRTSADSPAGDAHRVVGYAGALFG
ncbi:MAG: AmmeMemoRadiSam system protein B [Fibrobacterota bacterium]